MADIDLTLETEHPRNLPVFKFSVTKEVTATIGQTVAVLRMKKGWRVLDGILVFEGTSSATVTVGSTDDADRFVTSTSTASAGMKRLDNFAGVGYKFPADADIVLTIAGANVTAKDYTLQLLIEEDL